MLEVKSVMNNKIAQGDVSRPIFSQLTFFLCEKTTYLIDKNIVKFVIYGSELVEIDTLLAQFKINSKICFFLAAILSFLRKRG